MAVPQLGSPLSLDFVCEVLIDRTDTVSPHTLAVQIAKQQRTLQQVFVITVDGATDVTVGVGPLARLDVDPLAYKSDLRPPVISFDQRALRFVVIHRITREF